MITVASLCRNILKRGLAGLAGALLYGCSGPVIEFSDPKPAELEILVDESIKHVDRKEFATAESDLEKQYKWHNDDIGYCAVLGIAQASNREYAKADKTFRALIEAFESKPEVIVTIRDYLQRLFPTEAYKTMQKNLRKNAAMTFPVDLSNLYVVDGFLSLAEYKFDNAIEAFTQILPKYRHKTPLYKALMDQLAGHFHNARNTVARDGYQKMSLFFQMHTPNLPR